MLQTWLRRSSALLAAGAMLLSSAAVLAAPGPAPTAHLYAVIIPHFTRLHNSSKVFLEQCDKIVIYSPLCTRERTPAR